MVLGDSDLGFQRESFLFAFSLRTSVGEWKRRGRDCLCAEEIVEAIVCFLVWFLFPMIGRSCDCWWENKRAEVSFFQKKLAGRFW
jgi:hypothetical protein